MAYENGGETFGPVEDWATDWDWLDDRWGTSAPDVFAELREAGCTLAFTERYGRAWLPVRHDPVAQIAQDTEHFSSFRVSVARPDSPVRPAPPITSDPPDHRGHRRNMLPPFSPRKIAEREDAMREYCRGLIAELDGRDSADAAADYAQHIPVHEISNMIGVPETDADMFRDWIHRNFQEAPRDNAAKKALTEEMFGYFDRLITERQADPQDDLATMAANAEIDGEPVDHEDKIGYLTLLLLAGIDTTWSGIGSGLHHFGSNPADRERLAGVDDDDPIWMTATEEVLRFYSPVTMARQVIAETEISGCPVHKGDQVLLTFAAANRDPELFPDNDTFVIDRELNRHSAFGLGIHRCLGSNLARLEMTVAFQEWLRAFPNYVTDPAQETTWVNGQVRGPRSIPVLLNR